MSDNTTPQPAPKRPNSQGAIIGGGICIKGEVSGDEDLVINGRVEGRVDLPDNNVVIGDEGKLQANIYAKHIRVDGDVKGDISGIEKVVLSAQGRVHGNIVAPRVTLEDGAKFKGSIDMDPSGPAAAPEATTSNDSSEPPHLSKEVKTPPPKRPAPQGQRPQAPQRPAAAPKAAHQQANPDT